MTYVVTDACIRCKYMDCVDSCPTEAFHEGTNMLVINPVECIDCGVCVPECPADAIQPDIDRGMGPWIALNAAYAAIWPSVTARRPAPADADAHRGEPDKHAKYFAENL